MTVGPAAAAWAVAAPPLLTARRRGVRPPTRLDDHRRGRGGDNGSASLPRTVPAAARRRRQLAGDTVWAMAAGSGPAAAGGRWGGSSSKEVALDEKSSVTLRTVAGQDDEAAVAAVWAAVSGGLAGWEEEVDAAPSTMHIVAWAPDGTPVGAIRLTREGLNVRISRTAVLPAHRGAGIGRRLVEEAVAAAAPIVGAIYVAAGRMERGFYSLLGFTPVGPEMAPDVPAPPALEQDREKEAATPGGGGRRFAIDRPPGADVTTGDAVDGVGGDGRPPIRRLPADPPLPPEPVRVMVLPPPGVASPGAGTAVDCVGLHHAVLGVSDMTAALRWYTALGFVTVDKYMGRDGTRTAFVDGWGTRLELVEARRRWGGHAHHAAARATTGTGLRCLVLDVTRGCTSLELLLADLDTKLGRSLDVRQPPVERVAGRYVVSEAAVRGPDGVEVGFWRRLAVVPTALRSRVDW
ncbi:hypothetical protein MMPV_008775 [Pyropia vietnamensis]